jgi:hypothetical protein
MSERTAVLLKDRQKAELVDAVLIDGVTREEVEKAESLWKPFLDRELKRMQAEGVPKERWPQHGHWDWRQKQESTELYLAYRMFGVECRSEMQGLMLVLTAAGTLASNHSAASLWFTSTFLLLLLGTWAAWFSNPATRWWAAF